MEQLYTLIYPFIYAADRLGERNMKALGMALVVSLVLGVLIALISRKTGNERLFVIYKRTLIGFWIAVIGLLFFMTLAAPLI